MLKLQVRYLEGISVKSELLRRDLLPREGDRTCGVVNIWTPQGREGGMLLGSSE